MTETELNEARQYIPQTIFLVTTKIRDFYVVASDPSYAQTLAEAYLNAPQGISGTGYGFTDDRRVTNIKILGDEVPENKTSGDNPAYYPRFSGGANLIITGRILPCVKDPS
jgi:hypothetical protein